MIMIRLSGQAERISGINVVKIFLVLALFALDAHAQDMLVVSVTAHPDNRDPDVVQHVENAIRAKIDYPLRGCSNARLIRPDFFTAMAGTPLDDEPGRAIRLRIGIRGESVRKSPDGFPQPVYIGARFQGAVYLQEPGAFEETLVKFDVTYEQERIAIRARSPSELPAAIDRFVEGHDEPEEAPFADAVGEDVCDSSEASSVLRAIATALNRVAESHNELTGMAIVFSEASDVSQDIAIVNPDAIVPENSVPGLAEHVGDPVGRIPNSLPTGLLDWLEIPPYQTYMGMTRDGAPESVRYHFREVINGVPGTKSLFDDRYAIFSACRFRSCMEKGWLMIDLDTQAWLGAIRHFYWGEEETRTQGSLLILSSDFDLYEDVPDLYRRSLSRWATLIFEEDGSYDDIDFAVVRFINADGAIDTVCRNCIPH